MKNDTKKTRRWHLGSNTKVAVTYWQNVVAEGSDIIICKVPGSTKENSIDLALYIIDWHNETQI